MFFFQAVSPLRETGASMCDTNPPRSRKEAIGISASTNNCSISITRDPTDTMSTAPDAPEVQRSTNLCAYCDLTFNTKKQLQEHSQTHEGSHPYHCIKCPKIFSDRELWAIHKRTHTDERPYACQHCEQAFESTKVLKSHNRAEHSHLICEYKCSVCGQTFKSPTDFSQHKYTHIGELPFECQYCNLRFSQLSTLKGHERIHKDFRYKCDQCSKGFLKKSQLSAHKRVHQDQGRFTCNVCFKQFRLRWFLKKHNCSLSGGTEEANSNTPVVPVNKGKKVNEITMPVTSVDATSPTSMEEVLSEEEFWNHSSPSSMCEDSPPNSEADNLSNDSSVIPSSNSKTVPVSSSSIVSSVTISKMVATPELSFRLVKAHDNHSITALYDVATPVASESVANTILSGTSSNQSASTADSRVVRDSATSEGGLSTKGRRDVTKVSLGSNRVKILSKSHPSQMKDRESTREQQRR